MDNLKISVNDQEIDDETLKIYEIIDNFSDKTRDVFFKYSSLLYFSLEKLEKSDTKLIKNNFISKIEKEVELTYKAYDSLTKIYSAEMPVVNADIVEDIFKDLPEKVINTMRINSSILEEDDLDDKNSIFSQAVKKTIFDIKISKEETILAFKKLKSIINISRKD